MAYVRGAGLTICSTASSRDWMFKLEDLQWLNREVT